MEWNHELAKARYYLGDEDHESIAKRVGTYVANGDATYVDPFIEMILKMWFMPAGRILRNAGRPKGGLLNCYFLDIQDDLFDIMYFVANTAILNAEGGGVGTNVSYLRPEGDPVRGRGGIASGPVSWLEITNFAAGKICTGGQRRAALKADMIVSHPDIHKFIDAKLVDGKLQNFNISVGITSRFMDAVRNDENWSLSFREKDYDKVSANQLWDKIVTNMLAYGEPGIQYLDNLYSNNSWYVFPIRGTNPCGEVPLEHCGVCCLGSLVLPAFVHNGSFDWNLFEQTTRLGVRFLDNTLDVNNYVFQFNKDQAHALRRIGIGTMGLAAALFALGIRYGSTECVEFLDKLYARLRDTAYKESIELSKEKGAFPKFDPRYLKSRFVKTLPRSIQRKIREHGIRNCTILTQPPTGTTAQLVGVTEGCEPLPHKAYERCDGDKESEVIIHPLTEKGCDADWFVDSTDLTIDEHFEVQATIQKYVDGAVSKTINVPKETTTEQIKEALLKYLDEIKGVTIYRQGSRKNEPIKPITCKSGVCDL